MTTANNAPVFERERIAIGAAYDAVGDTLGGMRGRAAPYGIDNGRPGYAWQIDEQGFPEIVEYAGTIWEPGVFSEWLAGDGRDLCRFLYQHGDANGWDGPNGPNSLPLGPINALDERDDGLYVDCSFSDHELAKAVQTLLRDGALREMSVCTVMLDYELRPGEDGKMYRHGTRAQLWDVSVVVNGQYGLNATVTELYALAPVSAERFAGAAISKANAETINAAIADIRDAAEKLGAHADALSSLTATEDDSQDAATRPVEPILTPQGANPTPDTDRLPDLAGTDEAEQNRARMERLTQRFK